MQTTQDPNWPTARPADADIDMPAADAEAVLDSGDGARIGQLKQAGVSRPDDMIRVLGAGQAEKVADDASGDDLAVRALAPPVGVEIARADVDAKASFEGS